MTATKRRRPRRRYAWSHQVHGVYVLRVNPRVVILALQNKRWQLRIARDVVGDFRTFHLAEDSIPAEALQSRRSSPTHSHA